MSRHRCEPHGTVIWWQARKGGLGINEREDVVQGAEPGTRAKRTSLGSSSDLLLLSDEPTSLTLLKGTFPIHM